MFGDPHDYQALSAQSALLYKPARMHVVFLATNRTSLCIDASVNQGKRVLLAEVSTGIRAARSPAQVCVCMSHP